MLNDEIQEVLNSIGEELLSDGNYSNQIKFKIIDKIKVDDNINTEEFVKALSQLNTDKSSKNKIMKIVERLKEDIQTKSKHTNNQ